MARKRKVSWTKRSAGRLRDNETGYEIDYQNGKPNGPAGCILTTEWREDIEKIRLDVGSVDDVLVNCAPEVSYHPCIMLSARDREVLVRMQKEGQIFPEYDWESRHLKELLKKGLCEFNADGACVVSNAGVYLLELPHYYKGLDDGDTAQTTE